MLLKLAASKGDASPCVLYNTNFYHENPGNSAEIKAWIYRRDLNPTLREPNPVEFYAYASGRPTAIGHPAHALRWAIMAVSPDERRTKNSEHRTQLQLQVEMRRVLFDN